MSVLLNDIQDSFKCHTRLLHHLHHRHPHAHRVDGLQGAVPRSFSCAVPVLHIPQYPDLENIIKGPPALV